MLNSVALSAKACDMCCLFISHGIVSSEYDQTDMWVFIERKEERCKVQRIVGFKTCQLRD